MSEPLHCAVDVLDCPGSALKSSDQDSTQVLSTAASPGHSSPASGPRGTPYSSYRKWTGLGPGEPLCPSLSLCMAAVWFQLKLHPLVKAPRTPH